MSMLLQAQLISLSLRQSFWSVAALGVRQILAFGDRYLTNHIRFSIFGIADRMRGKEGSKEMPIFWLGLAVRAS